MNKAIMMAIQPKWAKMIIDGEKEFEFRNYPIPKGMKVYLYCSKGKELLWIKNGKCITDGQYNRLLDELPNHLLSGKVVAEFVVDWYWDEDDIDGALFEEDNLPNYFAKIGYTNQKYAIKIKDLIVYDEEWQNDYFENTLTYRECKEQDKWDVWDLNNKVDDAPTSPIPVTEFTLYNKGSKMKSHPQGKVYVVEKEQ